MHDLVAARKEVDAKRVRAVIRSAKPPEERVPPTFDPPDVEGLSAAERRERFPWV
jgi:hypothetical protein